MASVQRPIKILIGKPGLDGHDRGAKVVTMALRDAGMEVIYTGLHQTPDQIVQTAIQEDVDGIGLSILSGAHNHLLPLIVEKLREEDADDIFVFAGGIIPEEDVSHLLEHGVSAAFGPGTSLEEVVDFIRSSVKMPN